MQVYEAFAHAETKPEVHTIIIDSLTYMMDMYESLHVLTAADTQKAWGQYAQFFKNLMQQHVAKSTKNVVFTGHTLDVHNEKAMSLETMVKVKGSLMNQGIESWFSTVISTKKIDLKTLEDLDDSPLRKVTPDDEVLGVKYVFQTRLTKETVNERIRAPISMWAPEELYIDNNLQNVLDRLHEYYD